MTNETSFYNDTPLMDKVAMFLLAIYPIIDYYMPPFGPFSYGQLSMVLYILYTLFFSQRRGFLYSKGFQTLWVYAAFVTLLFHGEIKATSFIPGGISFCMFALALGVFSDRFSFKYLKIFLRSISAVSIAIFAAQELMYYRSGVRFVAVIPFTTTNYADITYQDLCLNQMYNIRSASIFMEPSYFAQYLLISLCVELFDDNNKKLFTFFSLILVTALILSKSGSGAFGLCIILAFYFYNANKQGRIKVSNFIFLIPVIAGIMYYWFTTDSGSEIMSRSTEFENEDTSGYIRSIRGFVIFGNLPMIGQIFGISLSDFALIGQSLGVYSGAGMLVNGFQNALIALGSIGMIILVIYYYRLYKNTQFIGQAAIILLLCISLIESIYLSPSMLLLTIIPTALNRYSENI